MITATQRINEDGFLTEWDFADERGKVYILDGLKAQSGVKVERQKLFGIGCADFAKEGIFNPSVVQTGANEIKAIFRCEPSQATWSGYFMTDKGIPAISDGSIVDGKVELEIPRPIESGMPMSTRPEDWRLFKHQDKIYSNFSNYFYFNQGFPMKRAMCRVGVAELRDRLFFIREMEGTHKVKIGREEKNWMFVSNDDDLFCIQRIEPFTIARVGRRWGLYDAEISDIKLPRLGNRFVSSSTNPIEYESQEFGTAWLMFVHQYLSPHGRGTRNRTYYQHALLICPHRLRPIAWTPYPLFGVMKVRKQFLEKLKKQFPQFVHEVKRDGIDKGDFLEIDKDDFDDLKVDHGFSPSRGIGDTVAKITKAVGIKPCGGCKKRRRKWNR